MIIGYFTNQYPKVSHTFIRREILALEAAGVTVERWALRGWNADIADPADASERDRTRYILQRGPLPMLVAALLLLIAHPVRWLKGLRLTMRMMPRTDRSIPLHLIAFLEAALLARQAAAAGVRQLHAHFGTNAAEVAMVAATLADIPYSFTVHGADEFDRPIGLHLGTKIEKAAFVVAITHFCASQLYRWCDPRYWSKISVVHCGLSREFLDVEPTAPAAAPHFVSVGRLSGEKGHLLMLEALAQVRDGGVPATLTLVGDGEMRGRIEAAMARLGLNEAVKITGWADESQVRNHIANARALVMASFAEGLPIVVMEAFALGRPVLATNVGALADLVVNGRTGWLFTPGSVDAIAQAMRDCADTPPAALAAMGEEGRRIVREEHDAQREAAKLRVRFAESLGHADASSKYEWPERTEIERA
ncbi:glycosyl transferase group 1 [Sphingobium chlorophenolicum L-1]|uniref:Glycosyl transferase group 1 n=1 Tax=Sphingobium chlorophenolicum L-1 TaxID=690566 RepID=F6EX16_SPHCR|nr:glycosyltransferase [Sphingobium chlorophenolicum]AEG48179.1 glycosyl transferase group 1 [Sphingobium chlorophenolicum L-1]